MKTIRMTALSVALLMSFEAASAQTPGGQDQSKEIQALRARVEELEKEARARKAAAAEAAQGAAAQERELNRQMVKTDALETAQETNGYKALKLSGYIEPVFIYNQRQNRAGFQFLNQQSDGYAYDTSFMGSAVLDLLKETDSGTQWRLTLSPNRGAGSVMDGKSIIQEASVSIPLDSPARRLIAGQIPDWSGYEYQQPTLNPLTSHNLLYDFTAPVSFVGIGLDVKVDKWWIRSALANANTPIRKANERSPSWAFRIDYAKGEFVGFGFASLLGKQPNLNTGSNTMAYLTELDGFFTRGDLTLQGQIAIGGQRQGAITPDDDGTWHDSRWVGISGLFGYMLTPRLQALVRADYIQNDSHGGGLFGTTGLSKVNADGTISYGYDGRNGIGPDVRDDVSRGANRYAITAGLKYAFDKATTLKVEYRLDGADRAVFNDAKSGDIKKTNSLLIASLVVAF